MKVIIGIAVVLTLVLAINGVYQVIRKPSELFFPVSGTLYKTPSETWRQYAPIFRKHATNVITPDLLAAIAQVEGSGNPVARTYWRWSWTSQPFEVYRPASSAVGMYQMTDGTFAEARRYCIHNHAVAEDGPWNSWRSCWFNSLYARVVPSHAVELTSAHLDRSVAITLERHRIASATLQHKQELAAVIHLCGNGAGDDYARRGFRLIDGQQCGDHEARAYLARINEMKGLFDRLARFHQTDHLTMAAVWNRISSRHTSGSSSRRPASPPEWRRTLSAPPASNETGTSDAMIAALQCVVGRTDRPGAASDDSRIRSNNAVSKLMPCRRNDCAAA